MSYSPVASSTGTFKWGQSGWKVWAFQLNFPEIVNGTYGADGIFGDDTKAVVVAFQKTNRLYADGIAGPLTQEKLFLVRSDYAEKLFSLPPKLLASIGKGESGYYTACVSGLTSDGGRDYGAYQDHLVNPTQEQLATAFTIADLALDTAQNLRENKDRYYLGKKFVGAKTHQRAWELAALSHNWPYAAERLALGLSIYASGDDVPRQWIIDATKGRLSTANQWVAEQISTKTSLVTLWTP